MKRTLLIILLFDVIICILLNFLTGTFKDALTMLFTSVFVFTAGIALSCIFYFVKYLRKFAFPMLLNSILLSFVIYVIFEISSSCRTYSLYVMYNLNTSYGEYQIYIQKDTNIYIINRTFDGGSEGVVHGTYISLHDNEYKLYIPDTSLYDGKNNELLIKNDSIHGFNGSSYSLVHE